VPQKRYFVQEKILSRFESVKQLSVGPSPLIFTITPQPMKNFILTICLAAGFSATTAAAATEPGEGAYSKAMVNRATTLTRALGQRIKFNEAQYLAVKRLNLDMLTQRRDAEIELNTASAEERDNKLADIQERYEIALINLLRPDQLLAYHELRTSFTAHQLN
jgi:hypothetical protein